MNEIYHKFLTYSEHSLLWMKLLTRLLHDHLWSIKLGVMQLQKRWKKLQDKGLSRGYSNMKTGVSKEVWSKGGCLLRSEKEIKHSFSVARGILFLINFYYLFISLFFQYQDGTKGIFTLSPGLGFILSGTQGSNALSGIKPRTPA